MKKNTFAVQRPRKKKRMMAIGLLVILLLFGFVAARKASAGGENGILYLYCYGDYYDPLLIEEFEEETGIVVVEDMYDTAEEMYPIIANNSVSYDLICTSDYMIEKMIDEDLMAPLDKENIPNLANIDPAYLEMSESFDPGNAYSVPHAVGVAGIAYNKEMVGDKVIDSWNDLFDPAFKDQIIMPDSVRDAYMIALRSLGYDQNTENPEEIAEATEKLKEQKPYVYAYANDAARDYLADGSAAVGVVWNGEYVYTHDLNEDVEFVVPKEGSEFFIDSWAIPKTAENKENAEKFIDFMCRADNAATNFEYLYYTMPNKAAVEQLDPEVVNDPSIFPTEETVAACDTLRNLPAEVMELYSESWKKVKGSS